jgi:Ni/Fe-hydrogenase subunit HybB-like protein/Fe-S-cluster-containing dehydrogenase component
MPSDRREFLKCLGRVTGAGLLAAEPAWASGHGHGEAPANAMGVLVDLTVCIGCRLCEHACKKSNGFEPGPVESYDDQSVFRQRRRPAPDAYTVVNSYTNPKDRTKQIYVKTNCLHCNRPACVSACIVGALRKRDMGAVTYDAWKCIGCRYCMVACPFQIPAYDYDNALMPQVRKCQLCFHRTYEEGVLPECVAACPRQTMVYGRRAELLEVAREKIRTHANDYVDHIYGEHEAGGTSWLYLSSVPFEQLGFVKLPSSAPSAVTESIQHGVFKHGLPPTVLYGVLGGLMFLTRPRRSEGAAQEADNVAEAGQEGPPIAMQRDGEPEQMPSAEELPVHAREAPSAQVEANGGGIEPSIVERPPVANPRLRRDDGTPAQAGVVASDIRRPTKRAAQPSRVGRSSGIDSHPAAAHAHQHEQPMPVQRKLVTPGVLVLLGLALTGLTFGLKRFIFGIGSTTNLDQQHPWGLWIGIDVASGVALAAGGFTSAFLAHVLHRERYHAIARPALLTAMLGYTFVVLGLQADLGRYYNVWHPLIMWQGNSVLFEVGMCVMCYLTVLYLEFAPIACERLMAEEKRFGRLSRLAKFAYGKLEKVMFVLVIAGCMLSCLHQSSLGNLMVIAPSKLHPLWWTPFSPLLFLLSAIAVGFPMVIWEALVAAWSLELKPEMDVLGPLGRFVPFTLGLYLAVKLADMMWRGTYVYLGEGSLQSTCWLLEVVAGVVVPLVMFASGRVRRSPRLLLVASTLVVLGVVFNRVNVFLIGYHPPYSTRAYFPSVGEFAVTIGLFAALMLCYRVIVTYLPVISQPKVEAAI